ncbi:hypothetical protein Tco_0064582 [Tanacetum coccineum]
MVKTRHDDYMITNGIEDYPSFSDLDRKIHVNGAYNLRFSCMIGYEHVDANFFPLLSINMMSKRFYNSIMKNKLEFTRKSIVGAFMNAPIFVGTFYVMIDFVVIEDMDNYRDEEMGKVSTRDVMEGILHPYQKLKKLYKGDLDLGPEYINDEKVTERLTRRHVKVHEMEW